MTLNTLNSLVSIKDSVRFLAELLRKIDLEI
jgi:hypothetical protein